MPASWNCNREPVRGQRIEGSDGNRNDDKRGRQKSKESVGRTIRVVAKSPAESRFLRPDLSHKVAQCRGSIFSDIWLHSPCSRPFAWTLSCCFEGLRSQ